MAGVARHYLVGASAPSAAAIPIAARPRLFLAPRFLDRAERRLLIARARGRLREPTVADGYGRSRRSALRGGRVAVLGRGVRDARLRALEERLAGLVGFPPEHAQPLQVARYGDGEGFSAHYDAFDERRLDPRLLAAYGQRLVSLIVYLNRVGRGGETFFPRSGIRVHPEPGTAIFFHNTRPDGSSDPAALHGGRPVAAGRKWIAFTFFYSRPYPGGAGEE